MLARNDLRQLAQRITGRYHLDPLSRAEAAAYVKHRLRIAGATVDIFTSGALSELYRVSGGIPRLLNIIGDRALLGGYSADQHVITAALIRKAASEVAGKRITPAWLPWTLGTGTGVAVAGAAVLAWSLNSAPPPAPPPAPKPAMVAAPAPVAPKPDLSTILRDAAAVTDLDGAHTRLFALWSARYVAGSEDACSQALQQGLECLHEEGGIASLRRFNRPAILPVEDRTGAVHQIIVSTLGTERASVQIGEATHDVSLLELQELWRGEFMLLWKPQQLDDRNLTFGAEGEPVRVLRQRLRHWAALPPEPAASDVFDDALQELVLQFQRRNGLTTDGVAGTQTQALLDALFPSPGTPVLGTVAR
jgi:general secretion pathway protein A